MLSGCVRLSEINKVFLGEGEKGYFMWDGEVYGDGDR